MAPVDVVAVVGQSFGSTCYIRRLEAVPSMVSEKEMSSQEDRLSSCIHCLASFALPASLHAGSHAGHEHWHKCVHRLCLRVYLWAYTNLTAGKRLRNVVLTCSRL